MTATTEMILRTLRAQAWERAKGELEAVAVSFWAEPDQYGKLRDAITKFVTEVEDNSLAE